MAWGQVHGHDRVGEVHSAKRVRDAGTCDAQLDGGRPQRTSSVPNPYAGKDMSVVVTALAGAEPPSKIKVWCTMRFDHDKNAMRADEVVTKEQGVAALERMREALKDKMPTCLRGNVRPPSEDHLRARAVGLLREESASQGPEGATPNLGAHPDVSSVVEASPRTSSGLLSPDGLAEEALAPGVFRTARPTPIESGCHRGGGFRRQQSRTWRARDPRSEDVDASRSEKRRHATWTSGCTRTRSCLGKQWATSSTPRRTDPIDQVQIQREKCACMKCETACRVVCSRCARCAALCSRHCTGRSCLSTVQMPALRMLSSPASLTRAMPTTTWQHDR